jgi:hypothetical protein
MNSPLVLTDLASVCYSDWITTIGRSPTKYFCVATSGYEDRSITWMSRTLEKLNTRNGFEFYVAGFKDFTGALSRPANDAFYKSHGVDVHECGSSRDTAFLSAFEGEIAKRLKEQRRPNIEVHVDYSCMPRRWYCELPSIVNRYLRPNDRAFFWYTPGKYQETSYPTAGTSDFRIFSGRPTLSAPSRTHFFGLGFDRIRSQAIWSVLDPHNLVCFYADPAAEPSYVARVERDNREALNAAAYTFKVPINDFVVAYSKLMATVHQFRSMGDVIIVPDGPKPLVLASSIVPLATEDPSGVVCFHVAKRHTSTFTPVDVPSNGDPVGMSFAGVRAAKDHGREDVIEQRLTAA